jgi:hypothetical protein
MYIQNEARSKFWPALSAHRIFWETRNNSEIYQYDEADDGPEVEIIREFMFQDLLDGAFK